MANAILDTNIYGKIVEDKDNMILIKAIVERDQFIIHNFKVVRDELRKVPDILKIYDRMVKTQLFHDTREIDNLAREYFREYKNNRGVKSLNKIINDFKIVAYASIKNCDLIFSEDRKTMTHPISLKIYRNVNLKRQIRTPTFYSYNDLKRSFI